MHLRTGGDDGRELRTGARAEPPGNPSAWPIRARSGRPHASWNGQVPIPAQIRIGPLVASVHLSSLPSALVSVSPRSARTAALGYTSADTVPAPRQNDRVHSAPVPAHTWRSVRPTVKRRLDRARAPSASAASGQPPGAGDRPLHPRDRAARRGQPGAESRRHLRPGTYRQGPGRGSPHDLRGADDLHTPPRGPASRDRRT